MVVETVKVELFEPLEVKMTLTGFKTLVGPLLTVGETVAVRPTAPAKVPRLASVMLNFPEDPGVKIRICGLEEIVNPFEVIFIPAMNVDHTPPLGDTYSPATHTWVELDGSSPAPK